MRRQTTHRVSTLVVVTAVTFTLLSTSPGWSAGAPAGDLSPAAAAPPSRTRRSSDYEDREPPAYGEVGEPMEGALDKRIGRLASWGKKRDPSWMDRAAGKAIRSKWSNSNMAVWGKRVLPHGEDKRGKWPGSNMAVWG